MHPGLIAVEGPIGVGKSTFIELLAPRFNAAKVLEKIDNPFLRDFYNEKPGAALQAQLFFLVNRFVQQRDLSQKDLFQQVTLCEYLFAKDKIFAYLNLDDSELLIYEKLYALLFQEVPRPDLVIYLQASTGVLLDRIRRRKRDFEAEISVKYLEDLNRAYNYFFHHYNDSPLLVINTTDIDFVQNESDLDDLVGQIETMGKGVQYYRPLSHR